MNTQEKVVRLSKYQAALREWKESHRPEARTYINQNTNWVRREVIEAGCFHTFTVGPPPAIGGLIMRNVDAFATIFNPPYGMSITDSVCDMIDQTIGVLQDPQAQAAQALPVAQAEPDIRKGYAFIAMPIDPNDASLEDILDAIKEGAMRCGIHAERVDEAQSNERITDRILESIRKAEYVIVDLTGARPNVFYEAGYAQGLQKTPIYIAREGTKLEFDLKDYPIIFFKSMKGLKDALEQRLHALNRA